MEIKDLYRIFRSCNGITTDTRAITEGGLFFALKGENFDGNSYALQALELGAAYAVVNDSSEAASSGNERIIAVPDTLKALQELARYHRMQPNRNGEDIKVIALTGTNGKTTTKELLNAVLSTTYRVTATKGNLNNSIGVPLTVLSISPDTEIAIVEMGASHPGDIKELVEVACPDYGLVTNVGKAHLLGFGSFEGVKATKGELYDYVMEHGEAVFVNTDSADLVEMVNDRMQNIWAEAENDEEGFMVPLVVEYGRGVQNAKVLPSSPEEPFLRLELERFTRASIMNDTTDKLLISTQLVGSYNADNVLAALAVGSYFEVPESRAVKAIEEYEPVNKRSQMTRTERNTLIVDAYNANPSSMKVAIENFADIVSDKKIMLLGDMRELGAESFNEHLALARIAAAAEGDCYFVGDEFKKALDFLWEDDAFETRGAVGWFPTSQSLADFIKEQPGRFDGATVLIKGSRGIRMENVIPEL